MQALPLSLPEIENRVCSIVSEQLGIPRSDIHPGLRLIQDLHCDSLQAIELLMNVEEAFEIALPQPSDDSVYKTVFTRENFRISDFAELVYLQQGTGKIRKPGWRRGLSPAAPARKLIPFTQLGGKILAVDDRRGPLFEKLGQNAQGFATYRRITDGMVCVQLPAATVAIGCDQPGASADEKPIHQVALDSFLIDREPVSTTAYCRFLNSIGSIDRSTLQQWFILLSEDKRIEHQLLRRDSNSWGPLPGTERMPMMLVSWFGADAYSRWANRCDLKQDDKSFLPSESQWEYAARGKNPFKYPWGDLEPTPQLATYAQHPPRQIYQPNQLPMAEVNTDLGVSPFGLRHMAGNVWQWCRDWYSPDFYSSPEASLKNPVNTLPTQIRSERGGSWVGPGLLCRSSYRRGRIPTAKGRCLGFRCVSPI